MCKIIIFITFLSILSCVSCNCVSTPISNDDSSIVENVSSSTDLNETSESTSTSSSSYLESSDICNSENTSNYDCSDDNPQQEITPEPPTTTPESTTTKPESPKTTPESQSTTPESPKTTPESQSTSPESPSTSPESPTTTSGQPDSNGIDNFDKGNLKFTANFFNNVVQANPGKSVIMSPYSTLFLLALLGYFASGETEKELLAPMNFNNKEEILVTIPAILDMINTQQKVDLSLAAKIYANIDKSGLSDRFKAVSEKITGAKAESINFRNQEEAADIMNQWVADRTNNKIQNLISPSLLTPDTDIVMLNALYFLGEWRSKFNKDSTVSSKFYKSDNTTVMVDMMNQVSNFKYAEIDTLNAQALELPYVNSNLTCLILLPRDINGVETIVSELAKNNALTSIQGSLEYQRVKVSLPKIKTTTVIDLKDVFEKLGITSIFDPNRTGLSGILADPTVRVLVTAAIQKATIEVAETGSVSAAANAIIGVATAAMISRPPPIPFIANHSYIYYLLFRGTPIFCGHYAGN